MNWRIMTGKTEQIDSVLMDCIKESALTLDNIGSVQDHQNDVKKQMLKNDITMLM